MGELISSVDIFKKSFKYVRISGKLKLAHIGFTEMMPKGKQRSISNREFEISKKNLVSHVLARLLELLGVVVVQQPAWEYLLCMIILLLLNVTKQSWQGKRYVGISNCSWKMGVIFQCQFLTSFLKYSCVYPYLSSQKPSVWEMLICGVAKVPHFLSLS